jgi:hypothetical protein
MTLKDLGNPIVNSFDQEVAIEASISGLPNESYFRVEWQKSAGDTYFGYMKVGDSWVEINPSQDCKNYFRVADINTTSLSFLTKVGEKTGLGSGGYNLKLRRYTSSCASYSDSDPITLTLNLPTSTPTETPSPAVIPAPTPTKTPTPSPTKTRMPFPTKIPTTAPTAQENPEGQRADTAGSVLGINFDSPSPSAVSRGISESKPIFLAFVLIGLGVIAIGVSIYLGIKTSKSKEAQNDI